MQRWRAALMLALCLTVVADGFGAPRASDGRANAQRRQSVPQQLPDEPLPDYHRPDLLYLRRYPAQELVVEVDCVEGVRPNDGALTDLRAFLRRYCDKPAGVRFVRGGDVKASPGDDPRRIALWNIDGPSDDLNGRAAFLYVLFYDSAKLGSTPMPPHVKHPYAAVIYIDLNYQPTYFNQMISRSVRHEAGHLLGLCRNPKHCKGAHCTSSECLMNPQLEVVATNNPDLRVPSPRQDELCDACHADLRLAQRDRTAHHMSFRGPVLVRQGEGYFVATLPGVVFLSFEPVTSMDPAALVAEARKLDREGQLNWDNENYFTELTINPNDPARAQALRDAADAAALDADPSIRKLADDLREKLAQSAPQ